MSKRNILATLAAVSIGTAAAVAYAQTGGNNVNAPNPTNSATMPNTAQQPAPMQQPSTSAPGAMSSTDSAPMARADRN